MEKKYNLELTRAELDFMKVLCAIGALAQLPNPKDQVEYIHKSIEDLLPKLIAAHGDDE